MYPLYSKNFTQMGMAPDPSVCSYSMGESVSPFFIPTGSCLCDMGCRSEGGRERDAVREGERIIECVCVCARARACMYSCVRVRVSCAYTNLDKGPCQSRDLQLEENKPQEKEHKAHTLRPTA